MNASTSSAAAEGIVRTGFGRQLILGLLVVFLVLMVAVYYRVDQLSEHDQAYIEILGRQQVISQQIAKNATEAADGKVQAFDQLSKARDGFAENLETLRNGDPQRNIPAMPPDVDPTLTRLEKDWQQTAGDVEFILNVMQPITTVYESVRVFDQYAGDALLKADEVANIIIESGASPEQVYFATRQLMLLERISNNIRLTLKGGEGAVTAADRFGRDSLLYGQVWEGLLNGSERLGIETVKDPEARELLEDLVATIPEQRNLIEKILENSIELFRVQDASAAIFAGSDELLLASKDLLRRYQEVVASRVVTANLGNVFAGLALVMLILLGIQMTRDARVAAQQAHLRAEEARLREDEAHTREQEIKEANRRNQEAILRLLGEISDLADGDLTVNATVTEDFTGAIADAINYSVEEMRGLVSNINRMSAQVAAAAQGTRGLALELSGESEDQAKQIQVATEAIRDMADALEKISKSAADSTAVAEQSVQIANKGAGAVRNTIAGMDSIRETIQETSKRIKRLGESSQQIGEIVSLIDDIADQTNVLALNAAIQASMAGEAGRGFAVVADEVQRLAERSSQATRQIEQLVKAIQTDTHDAVISMEKSTSGVVEGAQVAEGAGQALAEIESVSNQLAALIRDISGDSQEESGLARQISASMNRIRDITMKATTGTRDTALSIGELAELADELRKSVAGFKLPEDDFSEFETDTAGESVPHVTPSEEGLEPAAHTG